jgi:hypothetical protein
MTRRRRTLSTDFSEPDLIDAATLLKAMLLVAGLVIVSLGLYLVLPNPFAKPTHSTYLTDDIPTGELTKPPFTFVERWPSWAAVVVRKWPITLAVVGGVVLLVVVLVVVVVVVRNKLQQQQTVDVIPDETGGNKKERHVASNEDDSVGSYVFLGLLLFCFAVFVPLMCFKDRFFGPACCTPKMDEETKNSVANLRECVQMKLAIASLYPSALLPDTAVGAVSVSVGPEEPNNNSHSSEEDSKDGVQTLKLKPNAKRYSVIKAISGEQMNPFIVRSAGVFNYCTKTIEKLEDVSLREVWRFLDCTKDQEYSEEDLRESYTYMYISPSAHQVKKELVQLIDKVITRYTFNFSTSGSLTISDNVGKKVTNIADVDQSSTEWRIILEASTANRLTYSPLWELSVKDLVDVAHALAVAGCEVSEQQIVDEGNCC